MTPTEIKAAVDHYSRQLIPNGKGDLTFPSRQEVNNYYRQLKNEENNMLGDMPRGYSDCGGLGIFCAHDPLQLMNNRPDLYAGMQAQMRSARNCACDRADLQRLVGLTDANAKRRLEEETTKCTRLEF